MPKQPKIRIIVFRSEKTRRYYFKIVARNQKIIGQSEGYTRRGKCLQTVELLQNHLESSTLEVLK